MSVDKKPKIHSKTTDYFLRLKMINIYFNIFEGNYIELINLINYVNKPDVKKNNLKPEYKRQRERLQIEATRRFFNFLSSAKGLVDCTNSLIVEWFEEDSFMNDYKSEISKRFSNNQVNLFIEGLRNFSSHYSFPLVGSQTSLTSNGLIHSFIIQKGFLLEWKKWTKGKKYLKSVGENIEIFPIVEEYYESIKSFHEWLYQQIRILYNKDFEE